jgi:hypothetical protein
MTSDFKKMYLTNTSLHVQIARLLNKAIDLIKQIEEWANCYFVKFAIGSPKFISKKLIRQETMKHDNTEKFSCKVIARTKVRHARVGSVYANKANSRGLLVQELDSKEEYWVNNWRVDRFDPDKGDLIVYVIDGVKDWIEPLKVDYPIEQRYSVSAITDIRLDRQGVQNRGLLIKNELTRQQQWVNDYSLTIQYSDIVILQNRKPIKLASWAEDLRQKMAI